MSDLSSISSRSGIPIPVLQHLISAGERYAQRIALYGSRARGDHSPRSDMDIAFWGSSQGFRDFSDAIAQLPTLLKVDLAFITHTTNPVFLANVRKDGVILVEKSAERVQQFSNALARLKEIAELYSGDPSNAVYRDALIQRFEFTFEVAWKSLKDYMNELGFVDVRSPRGAIQEAYAQSLISADNEAVWLDILKARNLTTHMYDEALVNGIAQDVVARYIFALHDALVMLQNAK